MADEEKECVFCKFFSKLFRPKKSSCCNMKIEEVAEGQPPQDPNPSTRPSCCDTERARRDDK